MKLKKVEEVKDDDVEMKEEKAGDSKKEEKADDLKDGEAKTDDAKKEESTESKTDEDKKEDTKPEEKKDSEEEKKETDDKSEAVELDEKPEEKQTEQDLVLAIQHFIKYITWDYSDAEYYLKEVKGKLALSIEDENLAMTQMLESFVAHSSKQQTMHQQNAARPKEVQEQIRPSSPSRQSGKDDFYRNSKLSAKRTSIFCGRS